MKSKLIMAYCTGLFLALTVISVTVNAAVPQQINYQGYLTDSGGNPVPDGDYVMSFAIYNVSTGDTPLWSEAQTVTVTKGIYNVILGQNPFPSNIFDGDLYLGVTVGTDAEMTPRLKLTSVPYAFRALNANALPIGAVIDWWRPNDSWPVPDGFQICNGSIITDQQSPLYNQTLPDLTDRFVLGVSVPDNIGISGGSITHNHSMDIDHNHSATATTGSGSHYHSADPSSSSTNSAGLHNHSIDVPSFSYSRNTNSAGDHNHIWAKHNQADKTWHTYFSDDTDYLMFDWGNGMDSAGDGTYPLAMRQPGSFLCNPGTDYTCYFFTKTWGSHSHWFSLNHDHSAFQSGDSGSHNHNIDLPSFNTGSAGSHTHTLDLPSLGTQNRSTTEGSSRPPYYGLLKIMRIR